MRAGLYARVSREEQAEGYSLDAQLEAMRRFCKERGWAVIREYTEEGYTGTVTDRPAFTEALDDCEAGRLDILLTHQLDRFYRNLALQLETLGKLGRWGVGLAEAWQDAPAEIRAQMLRAIFEEIRVDLGARRVVAVKPWPPFVPLFRMDGLEERETGVFYVRDAEREARSEG